MDGQPSSNLYVKDLPGGTKETTVWDVFAAYGSVESVKVLGGGFAAMVKLSSLEDAKWIVENVNGNIPEGLSSPVVIKYASLAPSNKGKGKNDGGMGGNDNRFSPYPGGGKAATKVDSSETSSNLYIKDMPEGTDEQAIRDSFGGYGTVTTVKVLGKGQSALVRFASADEAQWIVENVNGNIPEGLSTAVSIKFANTPGSTNQGAGKSGNVSMMGGMGKGMMGDMGKGNVMMGGGDMGMMSGKGGGKGQYNIEDFIKQLAFSGTLPGGRKYTNDENTLYVAGLAANTTACDIYRMFSPFGPIAPEGVWAKMEKGGNQCDGIGFVNFLDATAASLAVMTLNGQSLPDGHQLIVKVKSSPSKGKGKGNDQAMLANG